MDIKSMKIRYSAGCREPRSRTTFQTGQVVRALSSITSFWQDSSLNPVCDGSYMQAEEAYSYLTLNLSTFGILASKWYKFEGVESYELKD